MARAPRSNTGHSLEPRFKSHTASDRRAGSTLSLSKGAGSAGPVDYSRARNVGKSTTSRIAL